MAALRFFSTELNEKKKTFLVEILNLFSTFFAHLKKSWTIFYFSTLVEKTSLFEKLAFTMLHRDGRCDDLV